MSFRVLVDINVILDNFDFNRRETFPESVEFFELIKNSSEIEKFISSSSIDNIAFLKLQDLKKKYPDISPETRRKIVKRFIKHLLSIFKIAKTPSYIEIDIDNIEDSLVIASAKAIEALLVTRDYELIKKYSDLAVSPAKAVERIKIYQESQNIPMLDLKTEVVQIYPYIEKAMDKVLNKCNFILGDEVKELERKLGIYIGTKHAIGVSSGTDALVLSLRALAIRDKGQEYWSREDFIVTTPFTFTATGDAILRAGATPLFVDIDPKTFNIDIGQIKEAIAKYGGKVVGLLPVHLYGQSCDMDEIIKIAKENNLFVVEDCAQSFGAKWDGKQTGSFGDTGCFSFFPSKNLGGFGDGGMITTDDDELAEIISMLRKHGGKDKYNVDHIGYNARLDTLQASILLKKADYIDDFNKRRRKIAEVYNDIMGALEEIIVPEVLNGAYHVYHQYTVKTEEKVRDDLQKYLKEKGISTAIYYPIPLHNMLVFKDRMERIGDLKVSEKMCQKVLSLPIEPLMDLDIAKKVAYEIRKFFKS